MSGTKKGGAQAAQTMKKKYGETFYAKIGAIGGSNGHGGKGFGSMLLGLDGLTGLERASVSGYKGGSISKRGHIYKRRYRGYRYYIQRATGLLVRFPDATHVDFPDRIKRKKVAPQA